MEIALSATILLLSCCFACTYLIFFLAIFEATTVQATKIESANVTDFATIFDEAGLSAATNQSANATNLVATLDHNHYDEQPMVEILAPEPPPERPI